MSISSRSPLLAGLFAVFALLLLVQSAEAAGARRALIVGIDGYLDKKMEVPGQRTGEDAIQVAAVLSSVAGYETVTVVPRDANRKVFISHLSRFIKTIESGDMVLVFFSGHGVEFRGNNYLLLSEAPKQFPADDIEQEELLRDTGVSQLGLLEQLQRAAPANIVLVINACRNVVGQTVQLGAGERDGSFELPAPSGAVAAPPGTMAIYATSSGQFAQVCIDGTCETDKDPMTVFTRRFIEVLKVPDLQVADLVYNVGSAIEADVEAAGLDPQRVSTDDQIAFKHKPTLFLGPITRKAAVDTALSDADAPGLCEARADKVPFAKVPADALAPCEIAARLNPDNAHFRYLYGHVLDAAKRYEEALAEYKVAAELGSGEAMDGIGGLYRDGVGVRRDKKEARRWYEAAAQKNIASALGQLGQFYANGDGVEQNMDTAVAYYEKAAALGSGPAGRNLGILYQNGDGVFMDQARAVALLEQAVIDGSTFAARDLGKRYRYGVTDETGSEIDFDPAKAAIWFTKAAESGDAEGMRELARQYYVGVGVEQDRMAALVWFNRAAAARDTLAQTYLNADSGDVGAIAKLADKYADTSQSPYDYKEGAFWLGRLAEAGSPDDRSRLGDFMLRTMTGDFERFDPVALLVDSARQSKDTGWLMSMASWHADGCAELAVTFLEVAAELGNPDASRLAGDFYGDSYDCPKIANGKLAVQWYEKAVNAGDKLAAEHLGGLYIDGDLVERDLDKALSLYTLAASDGYRVGRTGDFLYNGEEGFTQDRRRALDWYELAARLGESGVGVHLAYIYQRGIDVPKDEGKAIALFEAAAAAGNGEAMANLGFLHVHGRGFPPDTHKGLALYAQAVEDGFYRAHLLAGDVYENGRGVPRDYAKARAEYEAGANAYNPDPGSAAALAALYPLGFDGPPDDSVKRQLLERAADLGDSGSQSALGALLLKGVSGADLAKGVDWLEKAVANGFVRNADALSDAYDKGVGVGRDYGRAAETMFDFVSASDTTLDTAIAAIGQLSVDSRMALQVKLRSEGLYDGAIDGELGSGTKAALAKLKQ